MTQDNDKLTRILDTAAEFFATEPFHKVLLSDVAKKASVGKGTLYLYFKSKEDLYLGVLFRGFSELVKQLDEFIAESAAPANELLGGVIDIMVDRLFGKTYNMGLLNVARACPSTGGWREKRMELWQLVEGVIRRGVKEGVFEDDNPLLTGRYVTGLIRAACLFKTDGESAASIRAHARNFVLKGLAAR